MTTRRRFGIAIAVVSTAILLMVGTSYARSIYASEPPAAAPAAGCGGDAAGGMHSAMWGALAGSLGLTTDELDQALADGKTLEALAAEKGINKEQLAEKMYAAMKDAVDQQVAAGSISREQADRMLESAKGHMTPEHVASMGNMTGSMQGGHGASMGSMHRSMHGEDEATEGSCHGDENEGSMMSGGMSMMGQPL